MRVDSTRSTAPARRCLGGGFGVGGARTPHRGETAQKRFVMHHWDTRHDVLADGPDRVLQLLRALPNYDRQYQRWRDLPD